MKRKLKTMVTLMTAAAMTMVPVAAAHAEGVENYIPGSLTSPVVNVPYADAVNGIAVNGFRHKFSTTVYTEDGTLMPGEIQVASNVVPSLDAYISSLAAEELSWGEWGQNLEWTTMTKTDLENAAPAGYEWKFIIGDYASFDMQQNYRDGYWMYVCDITNASNWIDIDYSSDKFFGAGNFALAKMFTVNIDGIDYPECKLMVGSECDDIGIYTLDFAVLLPQNFNGNASLHLYGCNVVNDEVVMNDVPGLTFPLILQGISQGVLQ